MNLGIHSGGFIRYNQRIFNRIERAAMTDEHTPQDSDDNGNKAQLKRIIGVLVVGTIVVVLFYQMVSGITELFASDAYDTSNDVQPGMESVDDSGMNQ